MRNAPTLVIAAIVAAGSVVACSAHVTTARTSTSRQANVADTAALMQADRDFAAAVDKGGLDAWVTWFAADGQQLGPGQQVVGHGAIREYMSGFFADPTAKLVWWPVSARIAASQDLGWTIGRYESRKLNPDGTVTVRGTGRYFTVWRKQPGGSWKVDVDTGNPDPKP